MWEYDLLSKDNRFQNVEKIKVHTATKFNVFISEKWLFDKIDGTTAYLLEENISKKISLNNV